MDSDGGFDTPKKRPFPAMDSDGLDCRNPPINDGSRRINRNTVVKKESTEAGDTIRGLFGDVPITETESQYLDAARKGDITRIEEIFEDIGTLKLTCVDAMGRSALHLAVKGNHTNVVSYLLDRAKVRQHLQTDCSYPTKNTNS